MRYSINKRVTGAVRQRRIGNPERLTPEPPSEEVLRERWGLSNKEAKVAIRMAVGRSDAEIADEMSISPHTARHRAEQVRLKLDVKSRAEVGAKILRE